MKKRFDTLRFLFSAFLLVGLCSTTFAQNGTVSGTVNDAQGPLIGASVLVVGTSSGTTTDIDGGYSLSLAPGNYTVEASYVGYDAQRAEVTVTAGGKVTLDFTLSEGLTFDEVVVTGTRASNRTNTDAPVPVDVINVSKLNSVAPQTNLNQLLHHTAPSFSSNTQTISDGTDHIDPASLRGLGPDQVLVLMNGKRRHTTSLVNVNGTFGRGNVGTDLNAIPAAALETIEILRDGAAAQYGSDAIAGVINLRLKETVNELRLAVTTGANFTKNTSPEKDIDGEVVEISANYGLPLGNNGGLINFTGAFDYRGWTNRMQTFTGSIFNRYNSVEWVALQDGADISALDMQSVQNYAQQVSHFSSDLKNEIANAPDLATLQSLLAEDATEAELGARGLTREDFIMRVGQSGLRGGQFFANMRLPVGDNMEFYSFGGVSYREGQSGCFYRLPGQNRTYTPIHPNGHIPKINSQIGDKSLSMGIRGKVRGWDVDLSNTYGKNKFIFYMTETANATLQNASPTEFNSGGHAFTQNTGNLDVSQYFDLEGIKGVNVAFGSEYRYENFQVIPGTEDSYGNYDINRNLVNSVTPDELLVRDFLGRQRPAGAQCFAGFLPSNEVDARRSSVAGYIDTEWDISDAFLLGGAIRFENYSDFGSTFNYKLTARYKINDQFALRGATSTGFRAPSLHQIFFSRTSTIFVTENGVTTAQEVGVFNNNSRAAKLLGIPKLKEETSQNYSLGFTAKLPDAGIKLTVDAYQVNINDRVVLTGQFKPGDNQELQQIFSQAQATRAAFFANAIDTESQGLDIVLAHRTNIGDNVLTNNLAATFSKTEAVRDANGNVKVKSSDVLKRAGLESVYFDETSQQYLEKAVPRTKITLSNSFTAGKVAFYLRNTYFGSTEEATNISSLDPSVDYTYSGKVVTDFSIGLNLNNTWSINIGADNLLDVYPDEADPAFQSSGRFVYSRRSPQFSYNGRHLFARVIFNLR
ncbi:MAG: TonB-dependent receptor [Bacteroidetes bacterium]|nr:MAG: TonB-dependent receptor [Bacteroidota bacterium]